MSEVAPLAADFRQARATTDDLASDVKQFTPFAIPQRAPTRDTAACLRRFHMFLMATANHLAQRGES